MNATENASPLPSVAAEPYVPRTLQGWPVLGEAMAMAFAAINAHKLRSVLTLIGIIVGVASVMIVGAFISGLQTYITDNVTDLMGSNSFLVAKVAAVGMSHQEYERRLRVNKDITWDEYDAIRTQSKLSKIVEVERGTTRTVFYKNRESIDVRITGCSANVIALSSIDVASGRFFQNFEFDRAAPVCVIGWEIRNNLFNGEDPLGHSIKIRGDSYKVVGVLVKRGSFLGNNLDRQMYVPLTALQKTFDWRKGWTIRVRTDPGPNFELAQDEVRAILRARRHLSPSEKDTFDILSTDEINQSVGQFTGAVAMVVTPITCISLLVGGIVIMNIMLVSVSERTREIGIRKAVGARHRDLMLQFLLESAMLGAIGGLIGIGLSFGICKVIAAVFDYTLTITPGYIALALGISGGIGLIAGSYPAVKAAKLDPIQALTYES